MGVAEALRAQFAARREALDAGAEHVGWKLGMGDRERMDGGHVIGHLTSSSRLAPGAAFDASRVHALHADAEVAVVIGEDLGAGADRDTAGAAIAGYAAALELCDLGPGETPHEIVAANVFHRAFALGDVHAEPADAGRLIVNGRTAAEASVAADFPALVHTVARLLGLAGEHLRAGDRIITGSVVQVPLSPGDAVTAELGGLGRVALAIEPTTQLN